MIRSDELRKARELIAADRKARKRPKVEREARVQHGKVREGRVRDLPYLSWLHEGIPCIACVIEGTAFQKISPAHVRGYPIEAAHQKHVAGKGGMLGKRPSDAESCPLCAWHHRLAPNACDPAQRKFWDRLGVDVGAFCAALHAAFTAGESGAAVVQDFQKRRAPESL